MKEGDQAESNPNLEPVGVGKKDVEKAIREGGIGEEEGDGGRGIGYGGFVGDAKGTRGDDRDVLLGDGGLDRDSEMARGVRRRSKDRPREREQDRERHSSRERRQRRHRDGHRHHHHRHRSREREGDRHDDRESRRHRRNRSRSDDRRRLRSVSPARRRSRSRDRERGYERRR